MAHVAVYVHDLPKAPLDAAALFMAKHVPEARELIANGVSPTVPLDAITFVFPSGGHEHHGWRLAAIQALAREAAPTRVNGVAGDNFGAAEEAADYLAEARGVTGQLLAV